MLQPNAWLFDVTNAGSPAALVPPYEDQPQKKEPGLGDEYENRSEQNRTDQNGTEHTAGDGGRRMQLQCAQRLYTQVTDRPVQCDLHLQVAGRVRKGGKQNVPSLSSLALTLMEAPVGSCASRNVWCFVWGVDARGWLDGDG